MRIKNKDKKRDEESQMQILTAEYEAVYHYALSLSGNETDAQDITQDAFLKAVKNIATFRADSSAYTWLCSITKNIWLDKCHKSGREVNPDGWQEYTADEGRSVEQRAADRDLALDIHKALHTLDEPYKEVFSLRVFGSLGFKEIASIFSKTESWARVTYHRARQKITEILRKEGKL